MLYETIVQEIPIELQVPMIRIVEAMENHLREDLAVRREDFVHLEVTVAGLAEAQHHAEQRLGRVETALGELAQAQAGLETTVAGLAEAQHHAEQRLGRVETALIELAQAQAGTEKRVSRLEIALTGLAEAQARTEQRVEELAQAQARTEQRVGRVEIALAELAQAQVRTEQRIGRVEIALVELAQAQARTEQGLKELTQVVAGIEKRLQKVEIRLDRLVGDNLEERYRKNAYAYLGRRLRNIKVITAQELESKLEEHLTDSEVTEIALLDVHVQGKIRHHPTTPEVLLAIEVSAVVDRADVERALRRAALLRKAGLLAIPTVAGEEITVGAEESARTNSVFVLQNGRQLNWEQAVASILDGA